MDYRPSPDLCGVRSNAHPYRDRGTGRRKAPVYPAASHPLDVGGTLRTRGPGSGGS